MSEITAAKPAVGGGIWTAPAGSTLPTNASTALDAAFKSLGAVSDAGVTRSMSKESTVVNAWGGQVVAVLNAKKTETFKFKLLEADNIDALGLAYGEATGTLATGITVKSTGAQPDPQSYVIETILANDVHQRVVIPAGIVTAVGDVVYVDNDVIGFDLTITAIADDDDVTAYEYMQVTGATGATGATA